MDLIKEIRNLEANGVFIHINHEHYENGSNCNWSVEFTKYHNKNNQTGWFGDNHEFGDTIDCYVVAIKLANFLLEGNNLDLYFRDTKETVTPEGYKQWIETHDFRLKVDNMIYKQN